MAQSTQVNSKMVKNMAKVNLYMGSMDILMKENGIKIKNRVKGFTHMPRVEIFLKEKKYQK